MSDERVDLTVDDAIAMLPEGEDVHTFRQGGIGIMLGADWEREHLISAIRTTDRRVLTGEVATGMGHGMAIWSNGWLFVATRATDQQEVIRGPGET